LRSSPHRTLPSFPTRRSSDLNVDALALHRFDDEERHVVGGKLLLQRGQIVPGHLPETRQQRPEAVAELGRRRGRERAEGQAVEADRKSTRLNSSHDQISYAVF